MNEASMMKAIEKLQDTTFDIGKSVAEMQAMLKQTSENQALILEVIKEHRQAMEAQEKRHYDAIVAVDKASKSEALRIEKELFRVKEQQAKHSNKMAWYAGVFAALLFILMFIKDPLVKMFNREENKRPPYQYIEPVD